MKAGVWREPAAHDSDLYPGLVVWDARCSGSITLGETRLPIWAPRLDWSEIDDYFPDAGDPAREKYESAAADALEFLYFLREQRGEFARLLLVLADAERREARRSVNAGAWWETKRHRKRVADQLRRCLACLEDE